MRSSQAESIIAAVSWLVRRRRRPTSWNVSSQLCSTNRLEHAQVRPRTHSFPAKSATLAGRCRPGSVQSLRPGVQMSAQDASYCQPVSRISSRRHLQSADCGHLDFPRVKLASYGGRSFAYAGPSNWNSFPDHLIDNSLSLSSFKRQLKTFLFSFYISSGCCTCLEQPSR